jgi:hypothetical protein
LEGDDGKLGDIVNTKSRQTQIKSESMPNGSQIQNPVEYQIAYQIEYQMEYQMAYQTESQTEYQMGAELKGRFASKSPEFKFMSPPGKQQSRAVGVSKMDLVHIWVSI